MEPVPTPRSRSPHAGERPAIVRVPSIGAYLTRQRKLRHIDLEELAALTKFPRRALERLESGAFDAESDGLAKGFVRSVAAAIGLDPDETLARMLAEPGPGERVEPALGRREGLLLLAGLALVAAGAFWWLREPLPAPSNPEDALESELVKRRDAVRELLDSPRAAAANSTPPVSAP